MDTAHDDHKVNCSDVTRDPLDELGQAGREMFEQVRAGLGLRPTVGATRLGRFVLGRRLGAGGMGVVHLAIDPSLDREVAIKRVRPRRNLSTATLMARLQREARALASLRHPNLVHVYELGEDEGEVFLAMEYVAGETLRTWQLRPDRNPAEILGAYVDAGKGLVAAHAAQIIHRDFKPDNVFISDQAHVQVGDFGLADLLRELGDDEPASEGSADSSVSERLTGVGEVVGTLAYMAPERLRGTRGDARSDQYSFCVALCEALTGNLPFAGEDRGERLGAHEAGRLETTRGLDRSLRSILDRGLSVDPERRYPDMHAVVGELERHLARPRRRLTRGALGFAAASLGLALWVGLSEQAPAACPVADAASRASTLATWANLRERLGPESPRLAPIEAHLRALSSEAASLCASGNQESALAIAWLEDLEALLREAGAAERTRLLERVDWLLERRLHGAPPSPLALAVGEALELSRARELVNDLDGAREAARAALDASTADHERAAALLRRGRVRSLLRDYEGALADFEAARDRADRSHYDEARLRANLRAAEIALKRLDAFELADGYLRDSASVAARVHVPVMSPLRATRDELLAISERRRGNIDVALQHQLRSLGRRALNGDPPHLFARGLAGLAVVLEKRGWTELVEPSYRAALARLPDPSPDRFMVTFMLGRWLSRAGEFDEARALLRETLTGRIELHLAATTELLQLEIVAGSVPTITTALADDISAQLRAGPRLGTTRHRREAITHVAMARALAGDPEALERATLEAEAALAGAPLKRAHLDLTIAGLTPDPDVCHRHVARARLSLDEVPPSAEREQFAAAVEEFDRAGCDS